MENALRWFFLYILSLIMHIFVGLGSIDLYASMSGLSSEEMSKRGQQFPHLIRVIYGFQPEPDESNNYLAPSKMRGIYLRLIFSFPIVAALLAAAIEVMHSNTRGETIVTLSFILVEFVTWGYFLTLGRNVYHAE